MNEPLTTPGDDGASAPPPRKSSLRFIPTLLRKNWLLKRKHPVALLFEFITPMLFVVILDIIKSQSSSHNVPAGFTTGAVSSNLFQGGAFSLISPTLTPQYAIPETTLSGLLLHLALQSFVRARDAQDFDATNASICSARVVFGGCVSLNESSPYAIPASCEGRVSPFKIAIVPDDAFTRQYFSETVKRWYPTVTIAAPDNTSFTSAAASLVVPSFEDSSVFFSSEQALDDYVTSDEYAKTASKPRIFGAIVFDTHPADPLAIGRQMPSIEYTLRLNATYDDDSRDLERYVPRTIDKDGAATWNAYQRTLEPIYYKQYATGGFMTLQTLVVRFLNCLPTWDSTSQSTTGACQVNASVATASETLDSQFVKVIESDSAFKFIWSQFTQPKGDSSEAWTAELTQASLDLPLTNATREALLTPLRQAPQSLLGSLVSPFPIESFPSSSFYDAVKNVFPLFFMLTYLHPLSKILVSFIAERETRSRELMKILGVNESSIIISWYLTYSGLLLLATALQTIAAKSALFVSSDAVLVWIFFFLFSLAVLAFAFVVSSCVSTTRNGTYLGIIGFFIMYAVSNAFNDESAESAKTWACLLAPVALVFSVNALSSVETSHLGMNFSTATLKVNNFRFTTGLYMLALDTVLYTLLGLYLERTVPKVNSVTARRWYSPLQWLRNKLPDRGKDDASTLLVSAVALDIPIDPNIERVGQDLLAQEANGEALVVQGLRKVFSVPGGELEAVKDLNLSMYMGQITCLLGHNGAGKTTLISMLTGMLEPSSGNATFHGLSLRNDMDKIRESLGICFQHDVLYPELTVREHLAFYARIKGYSGQELADEVAKSIADVGLTDKAATVSSALSGGMKRKLSVAISLLGDSSLVFLDEPTSGMDPYSRRNTWEILMSHRHDRVLVLTTHFMDEADILGDRIAILADGALRCCGSPLFLKNRFGVGYTLTIVKQDECDESRVIEFVSSHIQSARVLSNVGTELVLQLPFNTSKHFAGLFRDLDAQMLALALVSYGISVTTMEEVFIKVAELADEDAHEQQHTLQNNVTYRPTEVSEAAPSDALVEHQRLAYTRTESSLATRRLFFGQFVALFQKRWRIAKRDKRMVLVSLVLPVLWLVLGLSSLKAGVWRHADPFMAIDISGLTKESPGHEILLPSFCMQSQGDWCSKVLDVSQFFSTATPVVIDQATIGVPPYATDTPTVFNVVYTDPSINHTGATGYLLKLSEQIYAQGFTQARTSQFGGFLVQADADAHVLSYNVLVNTTLMHGSAAFKALMDQSVYRLMASQLNPASDVSELTLKVNSHPLPQTASTTALFDAFVAFFACIFIAVAFAYYPASIVVLLVREREPQHNSKHQQLVSGVSIPAFWLANLTWDLLVYVIPLCMALVLIVAYDLSTFTGGSSCETCTSATFPAVVLLFVAFGLAICPYAYCWSFVFKDAPASQTYMILINFMLGMALLIVSYVLDVIVQSAHSVNSVLKFFYRLSPLYNLGAGLLNLTMIEINHANQRHSVNSHSADPFALGNMGYELLFMVLDAVLYFCLAVGIDYALTFPKFKAALAKDPLVPLKDDPAIDQDVANEVHRVESGAADTDVITLWHLRKVFRSGPTVALEDLTFGLKRGECFGFLGINGAGKTTTMKILTGDIVPTSGSATLSGFDILTQQVHVRREIGYCPQFDALIDLLTVREHLELFARIKGIAKADLDREVNDKMAQLNLLSFEDKLAGSLSGGNKRKLSVAIAMIGSPSILFLDEPSTGMDPVSRRFMWDVIADISTYKKQSTILLTTHSMEECEALCTRVGIMVGGALKCLGGVQHLKNRFGDGLMFDAKLQPPRTLDAQELALRHFDSTDARISLDEIASTCALFGQPTWEQKIVNTHPTGYMLANHLHRDGYVLAGTFAAWWLVEAQFEAVATFLQENFGFIELLERQNDSCWFKLRGSDVKPSGFQTTTKHEELRLATVFELVEAAKARLAIREYSVSQTTLEQIFNYFASQQKAGDTISSTPTGA